MSNYNYEYLANLNSLSPESTVPVMSEEELARHLDCWIHAEFPQYDVLTAVDTKLEDQDTQSSMVLQHDLTLTEQTQQSMQYPLFTFSTANSFLQSNNFTPIFPAPAPIVPVTVPTSVSILPKNPTEDPAKATSSTPSNTTTDPTATVATTKNTTTTTTSSSTGGAAISSNRKNSSVKSSNTETTRSESTKTQDDEKVDPELAAKLAAEEDKRKRNTAASARFRVKKKLREQALERTAREMTTKAEALEGRVKELEMEIKWLRSLIVEKDARLLDIDRPGKKRKKDESDGEEKVKKEEDVVKLEQSDQTNQKE